MLVERGDDPVGDGGEFDVFALGGVDEGGEGGVLVDPAGGHQGTFRLFDDAPVLHGGFQPGEVVASAVEVAGETDDGFPDGGVDLQQGGVEVAEAVAVDTV